MTRRAPRARWRGAWRLAAAALGLAALGGCAALNGNGPPDSDSAPDTAVPAARALYRVEVQASDELRKLLLTHLDIARFQDAPATDAITADELSRLAAATPAQARALLETEGYFSADVRVERGAGDDGVPRLRVRVVPGPRTTVGRFTLELAGELHTLAERGDPPARALAASLQRGWPLKSGEPFRQAAWSDAKSALLARLHAEGYPAASWSSTGAQVDADAHQARLVLVADSGPLFRLGALRIEGLERHDEQAVRHLADFAPGAPYSEQQLLDFQERLLKVGLFEGAAVDIDPDPAHAADATVTVRLRELPLQQAIVGAGISANTGARVTFEHLHRRVAGSRWIAKNKFVLGADLKSWEGELTSHPLEGRYRNLVSGSAERLRAADELRTSWSARVGRTQDTSRLDRLYFLELTHSRLQTAVGTTASDAVSANVQWVFRRLDNVLLPTDGDTLSAQAALGYARSRQDTLANVTGDGAFSRVLGRYTWYRPLGAAWYATARVEAGQVFAAPSVGVPDTLLFRAGGDESVRGYAYRTLGPTVAGAVTSGRVLLTGSAEIARPISRRQPQFWWAAFADAGNAADGWGDLRPALGYGVGLRWRSPVGPLRLDLAYGQEVRKARLHLSVGIAF